MSCSNYQSCKIALHEDVVDLLVVLFTVRSQARVSSEMFCAVVAYVLILSDLPGVTDTIGEAITLDIIRFDVGQFEFTGILQTDVEPGLRIMLGLVSFPRTLCAWQGASYMETCRHVANCHLPICAEVDELQAVR